jgi:hypothetical protein
LHRDQIAAAEKVIEKIKACPEIGESKIGDLINVRVYKFHLSNQLILLAYIYDEEKQEITLLSLASHENFYRDLKNQVKS